MNRKTENRAMDRTGAIPNNVEDLVQNLHREVEDAKVSVRPGERYWVVMPRSVAMSLSIPEDRLRETEASRVEVLPEVLEEVMD